MSMSSDAFKPATSRLPDVIGLGGAIAGIGGGLAMAVVAALLARFMGEDVWRQPQAIAVVVYGPAAVADAGFALQPALVGSVIHLIVSALLGAIFGIVTRRVFHLTSEFGTPLLIGMIYGMIVWLLAYFLALPLLNPVLLETYAPSFIIQHITYGAVTGLIYTVLRPKPYDEFE